MSTVWVINQYASTPDTGMGGRHFYLARELAKQGHKVYVIAESSHHLLRHPPEMTESVKFARIDGFTFVWMKLPSYKGAHSYQRVINWFLFAWYIQRLARLIKDEPDALLCSSPSLVAFLGAQRLAKRFKAKLVFEVRDIWPLTLTEIGGYSSRHPFIRFMQWIEDKAYRDAGSVVSNLKYAVEHMVRRGMDRRKFVWIPNGFSLDEVELCAALNERACSLLPNDKFIVGYAGTFGVANDLDTFIEAAHLLRNEKDIAFVLVGDGKERDALVSRIKRKALSNVIVVDPVPKIEIQALLAKFDVCFIGLVNQPLFRFGVSPNKLFDYLYSGRPILYAIDSGPYKPVEEAGAGIHVPAEDPKRLAESVRHLSSLPADQRLEMGRNGRQLALMQHEYGALAEKLAQVLFVR